MVRNICAGQIMKALFLAIDDQRVILDELYRSILSYIECDFKKLNRSESKNLKKTISEYSLKEYDRVILLLRFRDICSQYKFLRKIRNLSIIEHDACQNYILSSRYYGKFSDFYRRIPGARIIVSGFNVSKKLGLEGHNVAFVPKGFDDELITNEERCRSVELGFIGSIDSDVYAQRARFLKEVRETERLEILKTQSGMEYNDKLNEIRYFLSCDMGIGEYMIKNYEAMASGCTLIAFDQGSEENDALGFMDRENIMLYHSFESFLACLDELRQDSGLGARVAQQGEALVRSRFSYKVIGSLIANEVARPFE